MPFLDKEFRRKHLAGISRQDEHHEKRMKAQNPSGPSADPDNSANAILPTHEEPHNVNPHGHALTAGIQPAGESGRSGIHPFHFLKICWRSTSRASRICNIFWPVVPAAIAVKYARPDLHLVIFILNYIAMIPCANLIGFAGQELGRKLHKVFGVLLETTLGSIVEIVLFMVLVVHDQFEVIKAAILGSILATQLLCLGMCFVVGGVRHNELEFAEVLGEVGSDLLLTAYVLLCSILRFSSTSPNNLQWIRTHHSRCFLLVLECQNRSRHERRGYSAQNSRNITSHCRSAHHFLCYLHIFPNSNPREHIRRHLRGRRTQRP